MKRQEEEESGTILQQLYETLYYIHNLGNCFNIV